MFTSVNSCLILSSCEISIISKPEKFSTTHKDRSLSTKFFWKSLWIMQRFFFLTRKLWEKVSFPSKFVHLITLSFKISQASDWDVHVQVIKSLKPPAGTSSLTISYNPLFNVLFYVFFDIFININTQIYICTPNPDVCQVNKIIARGQLKIDNRKSAFDMKFTTGDQSQLEKVHKVSHCFVRIEKITESAMFFIRNRVLRQYVAFLYIDWPGFKRKISTLLIML